MGKLSMVVVIGFAAIVGIVGTTLNRRTSEAQNNNSSVYEKAQARNIAKSGAEIYVRKLREDPNYSRTLNFGMDDGFVTVGANEKVTGKRDRLGMVSKATYGNSSYSITVDATDDNSLQPRVDGALCISYLSRAMVKLDKKAEVNGNNHDLDGNPSGMFPAVAGISIGHPDQIPNLEYDASAVAIIGKGIADPNIETQAPQKDYYKWVMNLSRYSDVTYVSQKFVGISTFGTVASPQITYLKGVTSFVGDFSGAGILILDGKVNFKKIDYKGVILAVGDSIRPELLSIKGRVIGAILMSGKRTHFKSGELELLYSKAAVDMAFGLVASRLPRRYAFSNWRE